MSGANPNAKGAEMTPREIVAELDKYIIGQDKAKKAVAIALRNRTRRQRLPEELRDEVAPKNIIMIGPTGVGKTEIARRLSKLCGAPFLKVEATKYTEVGYVGRDVESMIRDLVSVAVSMVKAELSEEVRVEAERRAEEALLDLLLPGVTRAPRRPGTDDAVEVEAVEIQRRPSPAGPRTRRPTRAGAEHAREDARDARQGPAGRAAGRGERDEVRHADDGDLLRHQHGGHGAELRKPRIHLRRKEEAQEGHREAGAGDPAERGDGQAGGHGAGVGARAAARGADGHHLHRRDRQDRLPGGEGRHRRLPGRRAARHPAHRGRLEGHHASRHRRHAAHPFHRRGRVPHEQALGPHSRAAGPFPPARRAFAPSRRKIS